ncbi:MAG: hypothetical protein CVU65_15790 [Deltaproteobacteria bacterium HGW-Deltaproteobacteria-22]|nr:MAG: hypothetical protein CVU65_15790 [Deltaproteobacteria bacterium HGW-Deltaproteobacteria-22]
MRNLFYMTWMIGWILGACDGSPSRPAPDAGDDADAVDAADATDDLNNANNLNNVDPPLTVEVLGEYVHPFNEGPRTFRLLKLSRRDGGSAYAMWTRVDTFSPSPAVLLAQPYDGIDWTQDPVDTRWADRSRQEPASSYPDEDGPDYIAGVSANIAYSLSTLSALAESSNYYIIHGISPLLVFGRFYAGDDIAGTVNVLHAGLRFLEAQVDVDPQRVGIIGGSWGGFMSIYGAAYAPASLRVTCAAYFPPVDFGDMIDYVTVQMPQLAPEANAGVFSAFFEPYVRRIFAGRGKLGGSAGSWDGFSTADVCAGLRGDTLVLHDDWDTLVPFSQSTDLVAACPGVDALTWTHDTPVDWETTSLTHGPMSAEPVFPSMTSLATGYLISRLVPVGATRWYAWSRPAMTAYLARIRELEGRGESISPVAARLLEWLSPTSYVADFAADPLTIIPADEALADLLSEVWEETILPADVATWLTLRL